MSVDVFEWAATSTDEEYATSISHYMYGLLHCSKNECFSEKLIPVSENSSRNASNNGREGGAIDLGYFFFCTANSNASNARDDGPADSATQLWIQSALKATRDKCPQRADFRRSREVRRVRHTVELPCGHTFTTIDSQPAQRDNADRSYARNLALWDALPRGHAEVREGTEDGPLLCEVVALRKFGSGEEKFGPLAREAGGARRLALHTLPMALGSCEGQVGPQDMSLVFLTKENGEMCKVSFFELQDVPFLVLGSKNVVLVLSMSSEESAVKDMAAYEESRFSFPKEMAAVFVARFFNILSEEQRCSLVSFVIANKATLCGESISPLHQHIQSYEDASGCIPPQIRFFALTTPEPFETRGLTLLDPVDAITKFLEWGLESAELCEEVSVSNASGVTALEEKHMSLPNREGAVVYAVVRPRNCLDRSGSRTVVVYKWKNAWYVTVRAMREKFCARSSESRILDRIRLLHIHHPCESELVTEFMEFYHWVLLLLPSQGFGDLLMESWVSLKVAYDAFMVEAKNWHSSLPCKLQTILTESWLEAFPSMHVALVAKIPRGDWVAVLSQHRHIISGSSSSSYDDQWIHSISETMVHLGGLDGSPSAVKEVASDQDGNIGLTAILVRGLQGSGKSSLCRALCSLLGGQWINQDEVAVGLGGKKRGGSAKELFLQAIESAASKEEIRYIFVDKIHTLRQHRGDVRAAIGRGFAKRGSTMGRVALALLNLSHPEDSEGGFANAITLCAERIASRGVGHLTLVPQATDAESVIFNTSQDAEAFEDDEKCSFDMYADIDMNQTSEKVLRDSLGKLLDGNCIGSDKTNAFLDEQIHDAVHVARSHEMILRSQWKTLYWCVELDWPSILNSGGASKGSDAPECLRSVLAESLSKARGMALQAVEHPHVTLLWIGSNGEDASVREFDAQISSYEGQEVPITLVAVCSDLTLGLVAIRVIVDGPPCANVHPHITTAKLPEVRAALSNDMLQRQADGDCTVVQRMLATPLVLKGTVRRKLASDSLAKVAFAGPPAEIGSPLCEIGLATTGEATDIFFTHDASARLKRIVAKLNGLMGHVSQPLRHCTGWPPSLRGKMCCTFHERPLSSESIAALRHLEGHQLQTLHIGALYFEIMDLLASEPATMQAQLEEKIVGQGVESIGNALSAWQYWQQTEKGCEVESIPKNERISFYVQCKAAGSQDQLIRFRQSLAFVIAKLMGWEPKLKDADVSIAAQVKDDWVLLGMVIPPAKERKAKANQKMSAKVDSLIGKELVQALKPPPSSIAGVIDIDGAFMEGGGQILRSAFAYGAVLGRSIRVYNIRGGRQNQGLRPSHTVAIEAIQKIAGGELFGNFVKSSEATLLRKDSSLCNDWQDPLIIDAGTGGSTMLILQAVLPVLLARSASLGGTCISVVLKGGTNVAAPTSSSGPFKLNAPQVDYVKLILFPVLRRFLGITLDLQLVRRGFIQGGGEVRVSVASHAWPLPAFELVDRGDASHGYGILYSSAGIPKHVLGRMFEGEVKRMPMGVAVCLRERLPAVSVEWERQEVEKSNGGDGCGLVLALETTTGCLLGGDSMGRKGAPAEKVGEEAARAALAALDSGRCADEYLEDQLVILMALANGRSRLRLSSTAQETLHTRTAWWLAEQFGASVHVAEDSSGRMLEIVGIGSALVKRAS